MKYLNKKLLRDVKNNWAQFFSVFLMALPLTDFWRQRDEAEFTGVDDIPVRFVRVSQYQKRKKTNYNTTLINRFYTANAWEISTLDLFS